MTFGKTNRKQQAGKGESQRRQWLAGMALMALGLPAALIHVAPTFGEAPPAPGKAAQSFATDARPVFQKLCAGCHSAEVKSGGVDLSAFTTAARVMENPSLLEVVTEVVEQGHMPPKGAPQPTAEERKKLVGWLHLALEEISGASPNDPGLVVMARINSTEYDYVLRDLTGIPLKMGQYLAADSGAGEGFLNVGQAQTLTPGQFEGYLSVARKVAGQARITPTAGVVWSLAPQVEADKPDDLRNAVKQARVDWFDLQQNQQMETLRRRLRSELKLETGAFYEAAWRYHHRAALGMPNATFADIAAAYDVPLYPSQVQRMYAILTGKDELWAGTGRVGKSLFVARIAEKWQSLPPPRNGNPKTVREACRELEELQKHWGAAVEYTFPRGPLEIFRGQKTEQQQYRGLVHRGTHPYLLDLTAAKSGKLYLTVGDGTDGNEGDFVRIGKGTITRADGKKVPWQTVVTSFTDEKGQRITWGNTVGGAKSSPDEVVVQAPAVLEMTIPPGAKELEMQMMLDPVIAKEASVQTMVTDTPPQQAGLIDNVGWLKGRRVVMAGKRGQEHKNAYNTLINLTPEFKGHWRVREDRVFANAPEALRQALGVKKTSQPSPGILYQIPMEELVQFAKQEDQKLLALNDKQIADGLQPAQRALAEFLRKNGMPEAVEGMLPKPAALAKMPAARSAEAERLIAAAQAEQAGQEKAASAFITDWAARAWRRPVTNDEVNSLLGFYREERARGASYDAAVKVPLVNVLMSPRFLYRYQSAGQPRAVVALKGRELAERLSFTVWGSIPDAPLLAAARTEKLTESEELIRQVRRMMKDERSIALATEFAAQWLRLADFPTSVSPDAERFGDFNDAVKQAMYDEVLLFLKDLFQNDRPITDMLYGKYTFVNGPLARYYGIPGVEGKEMRRVRLTDERRAGIITMGAVLTKTSSSLRTSPVKRGAWVYELVLGNRLPPPPPNVPQISDDERNEEGLSVRAQLEIHSKNEACASCHQRFDPLGVALENFDPTGRWREKDRSGAPVDSKARFLQTGEMMNGVTGLHTYLREHQDQFVRAFCRKLLGYSLGRAVLPTDRALLDEMEAALRANDYRPSVALEKIVMSRQFRYRRNAPASTPIARKENS